jgi:putative ABC transport system permease protein
MLIRTTEDPRSLVPAIRAIIHRANPEAPFSGVTTVQEEIDRATAPRRFILQLVGIFSLLGVGLAMIGVYGVIAESVAERVREIGIRIALGAQRSDVIRMILRQGAWMITAGVLIGLAGAFVLRREMSSLVYGVSTVDPLSYAAAAGALVAAALVACLIPARRASRLDPVVALRTE